MRLERWYRSIVENSKENPPEQVWEGIQDELDIDMVWEKLDSNLNKQKKTSRIVAFSTAASVLVLIAFGLAYFSTNSLRESEQLSSNQVSEPASQLNGKDENTVLAQTNDTIPNIVDSQRRAIPQKSKDVRKVVEAKMGVSETSGVEVVTIRENSNQPIKPIPSAKVSNISIQPEKIAYVSKDSDVGEHSSSKQILSGLHIGLTGQLANTWMLNNKTIQGFDKTELTATHATFAKSMGAHMGSSISKRLDVYAEFYWVSQSKQTYSEYIHGSYVNTSIELDYYTFSAMLKYRVAAAGQNHSLIGGIYLGNMKNAKQLIGNIENNVDYSYSNWDYGLLLGYGYPISISENLVLTPGVNTRVGLINIFSGDDQIPSYLNRTQNLSLNFSLSVSYTIF